MMKHVSLVLALLAIVSALGAQPAITEDQTITEKLSEHVRYLASDELEGRLVGSEGIKKARSYILAQFSQIGLKPAFGDTSYLQPFTFEFGYSLTETPSFRIGEYALEYPIDFKIIPISASAKVSAQGVIVAGDSLGELNMQTQRPFIAFFHIKDSIEDERWTVVGKDGVLNWMLERSEEIAKVGAKAVIFVHGNENNPQPDLHQFATRRIKLASIPVVEITYRVFQRALHANHIPQNVATSLTSSEVILRPLGRGTTCWLEVSKAPRTVTEWNIGGLLRGSDRPNKCIVVGAHYDHLGYGDIASATPWRREIHNGADDNASGVAALIEIARLLKQRHPPMTILFLAFSAEELGALGSEHYCSQPALPLENTVAMINLDTVGRLKEKLIIFGARSAEEFHRLIAQTNAKYKLDITQRKEIYGFSDQNPFYSRKIPSLHFFTGAYPDYHTPDDDWENLNFEGLAIITEFVADLIYAISSLESDLTPVVEAEEKPAPAGRRGKGAFLGIVPDFTHEGMGVKLAGCVEGSPAERAHLTAGDILLSIDGEEITGLKDLMVILSQKNPGDKVEIVVQRKGKVIKLTATLGVRSPRGKTGGSKK